MPGVLIDTGPLVAILNVRDIHHAWAVNELKNMSAPLLTCDAVLSEAFFLLQRTSRGISDLITLIDRQIVVSNFSFKLHARATLKLLDRYRNVPMSFADACIARMSEITEGTIVFTTDSDFGIYRKSDRTVIPRITPT
jgi:uncharacterized protein